MTIKRGTTAVNILAIPTIFFIISTVTFFVNTLLPLLLSSEDYYGVPYESIGSYTSTSLMGAQIFPLVTLPAYALIYEQVGRKIPLAFALLTTCAAVYFLPRVAPSFGMLVALRSLIGLNNSLVIGAPLIIDSVKKESRGRAISIQTFSIGVA